MQTYEILVRNRSVVANSPDMTLVRTSVGIDQVHVLFDNPEWLGFPITITFAQGDDIVTQSLVISEIADPDEWVAEATVTVPCEVVDMTGAIRVTLQGTDSDGNHIITAAGSPLSVEEAGDVVTGDVPSDAPTVDQWQQAYSDAMVAVGQAQTLVQNLRDQLDEMVAHAADNIDGLIDERIVPATEESLGTVMVGDGLRITEDGVLSAEVTESSAMTNVQKSLLYNLQRLAFFAFDVTFDDDGILVGDDVGVKRGVMPKARYDALGVVRPDGTSITIDTDGVIRYELPKATSEQLGGVKVDGDTIHSDDGVVSVPMASVEHAGIVRPDGTTISITSDGVITATGGGADGYILPTASDTQLGGVKVDGDTLVMDDSGVLSVAYVNANEVGF